MYINVILFYFSVRAKNIDVGHVIRFFADIKCPLTDMLRAEALPNDEVAPAASECSEKELELFGWPRKGESFHCYQLQESGGRMIFKRLNFPERFE